MLLLLLLPLPMRHATHEDDEDNEGRLEREMGGRVGSVSGGRVVGCTMSSTH